MRLQTTANHNDSKQIQYQQIMKKAIIIASLLALNCTAMTFAQKNDPVIMTINGQDVLRSEFEYSYNKNNSEGVIDKKSVEEYVNQKCNKQKVNDRQKDVCRFLT